METSAFGREVKRKDPTLGPRVRSILIWTVAIGGVLGIGFGVPPIRWAIWMAYAGPTMSGNYVWSGEKGILAGTADNPRLFALGSPMGNSVKNPIFAISAGSLFFYAPEEKAVGIVNVAGKRTWATVESYVGENDKVVEMTPSRGGVSLLVQDLSDTAGVRAKYRATKTIEVTAAGSASTPYREGEDYRTDRGSAASAWRDAEGGFIFKDSSGNSRSLISRPEAFEWAYDFPTGVFAASDEKNVYLGGKAPSKYFMPAFLHTVGDVYIASDRKEIWVEVMKPVGGTCVMVYDFEGNVKGMGPKGSGRIREPYYTANTVVMQLLEASQGPGR